MKCQVYSKLADLPPRRSASGSEWQFQIFTVRGHMDRSTGRSISHRSASGSEWQFQIFTVRAYMGRSTGRSTPTPSRSASASEWQFHIPTVRDQMCHFTDWCSKDKVIKDLPFHRCLQWELRQTRWQIYPPWQNSLLVLASSGQEWQFHISTVRAHIGTWRGRSTGRSSPLQQSSIDLWKTTTPNKFHI